MKQIQGKLSPPHAGRHQTPRIRDRRQCQQLGQGALPAAGANLWDALHTGKDHHHQPEPDLEAEP